MESAAFLEFKTVKKGVQVLGSWVAKVGEDICSPSIAIPSSQVTPGDLFQNPERGRYEWFQGSGYR